MRNALTLLIAAVALGQGGGAFAADLMIGGRRADGLNFTYTIGKPLPDAVVGQVTSVYGSVPFDISTSAGWLSVSPTSGTTPSSITVSVNPSGLAPGDYSGSITVHTSYVVNGKTVDGYDTSNVSLKVIKQADVAITCPSGTLTFSGTVGQPLGSQNISIMGAGDPIPYSISSSQGWLGATSGNTGTPSVVSINPSALQAGNFSGVLTISVPGGNPNSCTVSVSLALAAAQDTLTSAPPTQLTFVATEGGGVPPSQQFTVTAKNGANAAFSLASGAPPSWLSFTPLSGTTPQSFSVSVNPAGLTAAGSPYTYSAIFAYPTTDGKNYTTAVTLNIAKASPLISFSPQSLSFSASAGAAANPAPAAFSVSGALDGAATNLPVSLQSAPSWVQVQLSGSTTPATVEVTALLAGQAAGNLSGTVSVTVGSARVDVPVTAIVSAVSVQPSLSAIILEAASGGSAQNSINLTTSSQGLVGYTVAPAAPKSWLRLISGDSGSVSASQPATLTVGTDAVPAGPFQDTAVLNVTAGGQVVATIGVSLNVAAPPPALTLSQSALQFSAIAKGSLSAAQMFDVTTQPGTLAFTVTSDDWIKVTPGSGTGSQTLSVQVDPRNMNPGHYAGTVSITAQGGSGTAAPAQSVAVSAEIVGPNAPSFGADPNTVAFSRAQSMPGSVSKLVALTGLDATITANTLLNWQVSSSTTSGGGWLSADQIDTAQFPYTVALWATPAGLSQGHYAGTVQITATPAGGGVPTSFSIPATLDVTAPVQNSFTLSQSQAEATRIAGLDGKDLFSVDLIPAAAGLTYTVSATGGSWLKVDDSGTGSMPATIRFSTDSTSLAAGIYRGSVVVNATAPSGVTLPTPSQEVGVVLTVNAPPPPALDAEAVGNGLFSIDRSYPLSSTNSLALVSMRNSGSGSMTISASPDVNWLEFDQATLSVGSDWQTLSAHVRLDRVPGTTGSFPGSFRLLYNGAVVYYGSVTLKLTDSAPQFDVRPIAGTLSAYTGYTTEPGTTATVVNTGGVPVTLSIASSQSWLTPSTSSLTLAAGASSDVTLTAAKGQSAGVYDAVVTFRTGSGTAAVEKTYDLRLAVTETGVPGIDPLDIAEAAAPGAFTKSFTITNPTGNPVSYFVTIGTQSTAVWVRPCDGCPFTEQFQTLPAAVTSLTNATGTIAARGSVTVQASGTMGTDQVGSTLLFNLGIYGGFTRDITLFPAGGAGGGGAASVYAAACNPKALYLRLKSLARDRQLTAGLPAILRASFTDGCGKPLTTGRITAAFSNGDAGVTLQPDATPGQWSGMWVPMRADAPQVQVSLIGEAADRSLAVMRKTTVGLLKSPGIPVVQPNGVVNTGDYGAPMAGAPGSYISIFGMNLAPASAGLTSSDIPTTLGGTQVTLGGRALPLVFVSPLQINAFVPYDAAANSVHPLQVVRPTGKSVSHALTVEARRPAMFLKDGSAARPGIVVAYRGSQSFLVDAAHPAAAGDILVLYSVGLGALDQDLAPYKVTPATPLARVKDTVKVSVGGKDATVIFAGLSPGCLGLYQVNARVPAGVAPGNQVPIVITAGGVASAAASVALR